MRAGLRDPLAGGLTAPLGGPHGSLRGIHLRRRRLGCRFRRIGVGQRRQVVGAEPALPLQRLVRIGCTRPRRLEIRADGVHVLARRFLFGLERADLGGGGSSVAPRLHGVDLRQRLA